MSAPVTALTEQQLTALHAQAAAHTCPFVDPAQLDRVTRFVAGRHAWASAIIGRLFDLRHMTNLELRLLDLAAQAEPEPPRPPALWEAGYVPTEQERADQARKAARAAEWALLRAALPVPVRVVHNYTSTRHTETHVQGVEHILVDEELHVGRLDRERGRALCFTPSKTRDHRALSLSDAGDDDRLPTCVQCVRAAYRITGCAVSEVLL
jgi:hypothetical protein